jgi:recombination protein RecT
MSNAVQTRPAPAPASNAVALSVKGLVQSASFQAKVAAALPKHLSPERFMRIVNNTILRTPTLAACDANSFANALLLLSQYGLEPDGRRAHLIPFRNNKANRTELQVIVDYKGIVELVMRSGLVSNLHADVVCENDAFDVNKGEIVRHSINYRAPRGAVFAVYAICRFKDGTEKADVMSVDEIEAVRKRSRAGQSGPWVTDWNEMAKKTVFRRLSKWLTLSTEIRDAVEHDEDQLTQVTVAPPTAPNVLELPETAPEPEPTDDGGQVVSGDGDDAPPGAEAEPRPKAAGTAKAAGPTPQVELSEFVTGEGFTFAHFATWAGEIGAVKDPDSMTGFRDVPTDVATRLLKAKTGMIKGLAMAKEMTA